MRDAMIHYLDQYGLLHGQTRDILRVSRVDSVLIPWGVAKDRLPMEAPVNPQPQKGNPWGGGFFAPPQAQFPFDLREAEATLFEGSATADRPLTLPAISMKRRIAFIHMLRGTLGEEAFVAFVRDVYGARHEGVLTLEKMLASAEHASGKQLRPFFQQWLIDGAVPRLIIYEVQSVLAENPRTRVLEYRTRVLVANNGTGTVDVPWILQTETDPVEGTATLGPGQKLELNIVSLGRPTDFALDPFGWIVSVPEFDATTKRPVHPRVFIKTIAEA